MKSLKQFVLLFLVLFVASCTNSIKLSKIDLIENINLKQKCYPECKYNYEWKSIEDSTIKISEASRGTATLYNSNNKRIGTIYTRDIEIDSGKIKGYYSNILNLKKEIMTDSVSYAKIQQTAVKRNSNLLIIFGVLILSFFGVFYYR
jgi:hypothetical protein